MAKKMQTFEFSLAGKKLEVQVNKLATHINGSCLIRCGDTVVLATAAMNKNASSYADYFPLSIEVQEKMYAAGKIKGSRFIKRDGRPTDNAILDARMMDRGMRPLFNQNIRNEIQLVSTVLSYDGENDTKVISIIAASIAVAISDIPWQGPLAACVVGMVDGQMVLNPTNQQLAQSSFKVVFSFSSQGVLMVDAEAQEATEEEIFKAFDFGMKESAGILDFIDQIQQEVGVEKKKVEDLIALASKSAEISLDEKEHAMSKAKEFFGPHLDKYLFNQPVGTKRERKAVAQELLDQYVAELSKAETHPEIIGYIKDSFESYLESEVSRAILEKELRVDGRKLNEIRKLDSEVGLLPRTHGSALFNRGETQTLTTVTLGSPGDVQILDQMTEDDTKKSYMHHYSSPPYSFGEAGPFRGAGRREVGHGALAEKALMPVLPAKEDFPYTILVVSEVMGSNGSSSMASTCGSTLSLMDAGVPIKKPVAGIAMGLASDGKNYKVLTDLQDMEDGEGGMDFKITGTKDGITAIQMDTKTLGLSLDICRDTLNQSKEARLQLLDHMAQVIAEPRAELSKFAPRINVLQINPDRIRDVIGSGGKIINEIIDTCDVEIDIEDSGLVTITSTNEEGATKAMEWVKNLTKDVEVGELYDGKVVRIMDFGAFVEILPGRDGMVHVSELAPKRVEKVSDEVKVGDMVQVKVIEIDNLGRINLSIKQADPNYKPELDQRSHSNGPRRDNGGSKPRSGFSPRR